MKNDKKSGSKKPNKKSAGDVNEPGKKSSDHSVQVNSKPNGRNSEQMFTKTSSKQTSVFSADAISDELASLEQYMSTTLAKRHVALTLLVAGMDVLTISTLTGYCKRSVISLKNAIKAGKVKDILLIRGGGRKAKLGDVKDLVIEKLEKENYSTIRQIREMIADEFDVHVSQSAVERFIRNNGYRKLKSGSLPAKANVAAQRSFHDDDYQPRTKLAKEGKIALYFLDAVHFVIGNDYTGSVYTQRRRSEYTCSGRQRHNVLGAINAVSKKVLTVKNDTYITATEICEMLNLLHKTHPDEEVHIILDNARYQKCKIVTELAKELGIQLVYLPPYSPNLNLIERLWKFVKSELRRTYYSDFEAFKNKIAEIIGSIDTVNHDRICKLIGEKVQLFDNMVPVNDSTMTVAVKEA